MKKLTCLLLALLMLVSLIGCGAKEEPAAGPVADAAAPAVDGGAAAEEEEVVVEILHYFITDSGQTMNDVFLEFEAEFLENYKKEHPNVTFNITRMNQSQAEEKIQTMAASDTLPDVFPLKGSLVNNYYENGLLYDMSAEVAASDGWNLVKQSLVDTFTRDGKVLGVPYQFAATSLVFYNEQMWKDIGYDSFPTTWEELQKAADLFKEKGITCIAMGNAKQWNFESCWFSTFGDRFTGTDWTNNIIAMNGKAAFTDPEFVEALRQFQNQIYNTNLCNPDYNALTNDISDTIYLEGNAATCVNGYWFVGKVQNLATEEVRANTKIAVLPNFPGQKGEPNTASGGAGYSLAMSSKLSGAAAKAAADYILGTAGRPYSDKYYSEYGTPGAFVYDGELDTSKFDQLALDYLEFCNTTTFVPVYDTSMDGAIISVMNTDMQELTNGTMTPEKMAADCQKALEQLIAAK